MSSQHPVVVTGLGVITAAGCGVPAVGDALRAGRSGLGPLTLFASPRHGRHLVGQVCADVDFLAGNVRGSRSDKLAWIATQEAVKQAGLEPGLRSVAPERVGVAFGSTVAGMLGTEEVLRRLLREDRQRFGPLRFHECASATELCARQLGVRGPCLTFSTACSAGAMAIAAAAEMIESGEADVMIAGGADSLSRLTLNGFGSLLLLDPNGCRPFDAARTGISLGEGAGVLVLEAEATARARGAKILARLSGWGASCDASHATAPHPEGDGALAAMRLALERSGLPPGGINYVSAHGTGTPDNDAMEAKALRRLFGESVPPFSSVKRFFGHTLAASGAIKAVVCIRALQEQAVPASLGCDTTDPKIGLEPVRQFRELPLEHILSNSFGFGGNNAALVFSRAERLKTGGGGVLEYWSQADPPSVPSLHHSITPSASSVRLAVMSAGVVSAAGNSLEEIGRTFRAGGAVPVVTELRAPLRGGPVPAYACGEFGAKEMIPQARRRKLGRLQQMALVAARRSLATGGLSALPPERTCITVGTGLGCLNETALFVENMLVNEERAPLPTRFTNSVHNACASNLAIELGLKGLNSTPTHQEISFEAALWQSALEISRGRADFALAGGADELNSYVLAAGARWGWWDAATPALRPFADDLRANQRPLPGEGAAVFVLADADKAPNSLAQVTAIRLGRFEMLPGCGIDASVEAAWICETLERSGLSLAKMDAVLCGANGWQPLDQMYLDVADRLASLAGRTIPCGAYKHCCGEYYGASAFELFTAVGLVRGEIPFAHCHPTVSDPRTAPVFLPLLTKGGEGRGEEPVVSKIKSPRPSPLPAQAGRGSRGSVEMRPPRNVLLYTLSPGGCRAMCCVCA
ncbi:MAG: beta-ketoacyl-[acyl-carrier-protein] synthase family protein [Verrucomicrobiota bacterium]